MRRKSSTAILALSILACFVSMASRSNATTWANQSLTFNYYFPAFGDTFTGSPIGFVADGSPNLSTLPSLFPATFSVTGIAPNEVQISYSYPQATQPIGLVNTSFNGFNISGPLTDAAIIAAFVDPLSDVTGLINSTVSFTANSVTVNLAGTTFPVGSVGLVDVQFAVPLPASLPLFTSGLIGLCLLRWRKRWQAR